MKKFGVILMALALVLSTLSFAYAETLTGYGDGFGGKITVEVEKDGDKITNVTVVDHAETAGIYEKAGDVIPAAIVEANGTAVETVASATRSSEGIIYAVNNAIDPANYPYVVEEVVGNVYGVMDSLWNRKVYHSDVDYDATKALTEDQINTLVASAFTYPSGGGQRSLSFLTITNRETINKIQASHGYAKSMLTAPLTIVICGTKSLTKNPHMEIEDAGIASMAISAQASKMGLGAVILSINDDVVPAAIIEATGVSADEYVPHLMVTIGYPTEDGKASCSATEGIIESRDLRFE